MGSPLSVLGQVREKLVLENVVVPSFVESPPVSIEAGFRNEGTMHEAPLAHIEVRNMFGSLVATGTLPERNVPPGLVRKIETMVGKGPAEPPRRLRINLTAYDCLCRLKRVLSSQPSLLP